MSQHQQHNRIVLLGPQRFHPRIAEVVRHYGFGDGPAAVITAGWQERESEIDELHQHLQMDTVNLLLHQRSDQVFHDNPAFMQAYRDRQSRLRKLQELYRLRLNGSMEITRRLMESDEDPELVGPECDSAIEEVRHLDAHHLARIHQIHANYEHHHQLIKNSAIQRHREALRAIISKCSCLLIAGGHVVVLLNRMRLFRFEELIGGIPIVAWSAGAMALAERVVLFHDHPPQGPGHSEILDAGLGLYPGLVPLPHASKRLRLDDPTRVSLFARRFENSICLALDPGAEISWDGSGWHAAAGTKRLTPAGTLEEVNGS